MWRVPAGVIPNLLTPMTADYEIDVVRLGALTEFVVRQPATGCVCIGVNLAESHSLSIDERKLIADVIVRRTAGRVSAVVSVSASTLDASLELGRHAKAAGADAVIAVPPYHSQLDQHGLYGFYSALAAELELPVLAYHLPSWQSGSALTLDTILRLAREVPAFVGLKDATFSYAFHAELLARLRRAGLDEPFEASPSLEWCLPTLPLGSRSVHSAAAMIVPELTASLYDAVQERRWADARALFHRFGRFWRLVYQGFPWSLKVAMELVGRPVGPMRPPHPPAPPSFVAAMRAELDSLGALREGAPGWPGVPAARAAEGR